MPNKRLWLFALAVVCTLGIPISRAQNVAGSIKGSIVDPAGAVIPSAKATLANMATGVEVKTESNADGIFVFPSVLPGTYRLSIEAPGFQTYRQTDLALTAGEIRSVGTIHLAIGDVQQQVEVTAVATPLQLASGERSGLVSGKQLNEIALKGRDFLALMALQPGVVDTQISREATSILAPNGIFINGQRADMKNVTVDGIMDLSTSNLGVHYEPNMDSVAEVKILASNYGAEYGRSAGGLISVVTKGGGRQFHGSGWWQFRNEDLNANNFFNNRNGLKRPPYRYNIAGFSVGGPVFVPGKFNTDKSKLFFFVSEEFTRQRIDFGSQFVNMPTQAERNGDFSHSFDANGRLIPIIDPQTGRPFDGNIIPPERVNPVGQAILKFYPLPNYTDPNPALVYQRNYKVTASGGHPRRDDVVRIDVSPTEKLRGFFRWINDADNQEQPYFDTNFVSTPTLTPFPGHGYVANVTYTISPRMVNEFILGKSYDVTSWFPANPALLSQSAVGNPPQLFPNNPTTHIAGEQVSAQLMPNILFGGAPVNPPSVQITDEFDHNNIWSVTDNLSWVVGSHQFKTGFFFDHFFSDQLTAAQWNGTFNFGINPLNPFNTGDAFANALLGYYNTYTESVKDNYFNSTYWDLEFYVQDNWRVSRRLTLDYGVRFYHTPPQVDRNHFFTSFVQQDYIASQAPRLYRPGLNAQGQRVGIDPVTGTTVPAAEIGLYVPGTGNTANGMRVGGEGGFPGGAYTAKALSVAPRFGFAFDPTGSGRTAIRGGIGIFMDRSRQLVYAGDVGNPPANYSPTAFYGSISGLSSASGLLGPSNINFVAPLTDVQQPSTMNYSLGIQRRLPFSTVLDVAYVGSVSRHLTQVRNINPIPLSARFNPANQDPTLSGRPLPDNFLRPYVGYGDLNVIEFAAASNYNSLQASVQRRFTRGLGLGAAYTWSKALGVNSSVFGAVSPYFNPRSRNYGPLTFDRRQAFVLNYIYDLPNPGSKLNSRLVSSVLGHWTLSGITSFSTGFPVTPSFTTTTGIDVSGSTESARITVVGDPHLPKDQRSFGQNFNTAAFALTSVGSFGNAGVGILRQPGLNNWDIALDKKIPIGLGENRVLRFRTEFYNAFNHTQFTTFDTGARFDATGKQINPNFGAFTTAAPGRVIAFDLRFQF